MEVRFCDSESGTVTDPHFGPSTVYPGSLTFPTAAGHPTGTLNSQAFCPGQFIALSLLGHSCMTLKLRVFLSPNDYWQVNQSLGTTDTRVCNFFFFFETGPSFGTLELLKCPLVWIEKSQLLVSKQRSLCANYKLCILKTLSVIYYQGDLSLFLIPLLIHWNCSIFPKGYSWYVDGVILHHLDNLFSTHEVLFVLIPGSYCYKINCYKMQ